MNPLPFLPPGASAEAVAVDGVLAAIHWHILVLAVGWGSLFVYSLWRFRRRASPTARLRGPGIVWPSVAIGAVLVGDVLILSTNALPAWAARTVGPPANLRALHVRVIAEQFAWNVHYPGPDEVFGPVSAPLIGAANPLGIDRSAAAGRDDIGLLNALTVPVGRPIVVQLSSRDVIHSFTLNEMRVKQDATPGMTVLTWFTATRPGQWEIGCSQLCGLGHYRMKGSLTVLSLEDWEKWQSAEVALLARSQP